MTTYASLIELKQGMNFDEADTSKDAPMQICLDAASAVIDLMCHRPDGFLESLSEARTFQGTDQDFVFIDECARVSLVETRSSRSDDAWVTLANWDAFAGDPKRPVFRAPYGGILKDAGVFMAYRFPSIRITAHWGYSTTVPIQVTQATIMQAARWFKRGESAWSDAAASGEFGQLLYRKALDPDIQLILEKGRLMRPTV